MHERHAAEQEAELVRLRDAGKDDSPLQGTVNKLVVILRDWVADLDRDALPAVRKGEEALRDEYKKGTQGFDTEGCVPRRVSLRFQTLQALAALWTCRAASTEEKVEQQQHDAGYAEKPSQEVFAHEVPPRSLLMQPLCASGASLSGSQARMPA